jgi:MFS transporter, DHA1 family, tetracycline resistance protein
MRRSPLLPIFLVVLVDVLALTIMIPLLPFYSQHFGASPFVYGLLLSTFSLCQLVSGPILGGLSDRFGRRPLLLISQIGTLGGLLLLAWADTLWLIFVARIIDGVTAGNLSIAHPYVSDVTTPQNRARAFGLIGVAFGVGFIIGPGITGLLSPYGYAVPVLGAAAMSALSVLATYFLLPADPPRPVDDGAAGEPPPRRLGLLSWGIYLEYFRRPVLGRLLVQFFLFCFGFSLFVSGFALFAERRFTWHGQPFGPREVAAVFIFTGVLGIILQGGLLGRLVARYGERRLVIAGFLLAAVGYVGLGLAYSIAALAVVAAVSSVGNGMLRPALTSEVTHLTGRREQGVALGLTQSLYSVAAIVAPLVGNAMIGAGWLTGWALASGAVAGLAFVLALATRTPPPSAEPPPAPGA